MIGHHDKVEAGGLGRRDNVLDSPWAIVREGGMAVDDAAVIFVLAKNSLAFPYRDVRNVGL